MTYKEKLTDPRWQKKRLEIMNRDEFTCKYCGDKETTLNIHHLSYEDNPWESSDDQLITLCKHCHSLAEYFIKIKRPIIMPIQKIKKSIRNNVVYLVTNLNEGVVSGVHLIIDFDVSKCSCQTHTIVANEGIEIMYKMISSEREVISE